MAPLTHPSRLLPLLRHLRRRLVAGLLLLVPIIITYVVLRMAFNTMDGLLQPVIKAVIGRNIPGGGALGLLVLLYIAGGLATNVLGRWFIALGQALLHRVPVVNTIYSASRQLIESFSGTGATGFKRVVMIEYPRPGTWTIGFLTGLTQDEAGQPLAIVYIPTAPTPNSGWVAILPTRDVYDTDLTVGEAMRLVLSGGIAAPPQLRKYRQAQL